MSREDHWLLPDGIEELLPDRAARIEGLRRTLLDVYARWGYELVIPPLVEYLDSLLTGTGHDLDLQTFKLTDQVSGRTLGLRADTTPQVARIDAHTLGRRGPTRLCYMGPTLHTRPDGFAGTRTPFQVGAEIYGHGGIASDVEVISLLLETLSQAQIREVILDLGHVGIYQGLVEAAGLDRQQDGILFDLLQRKAVPEIAEFLHAARVTGSSAEWLQRLAGWNGDPEILDRLEGELSEAGPVVRQAIAHLRETTTRLRRRYPRLALHIDLAELRGYHYHTGIVFAAFVPRHGQEIARGGRYDDIGEVFGRARPATGFSTDLRTLEMLGDPPRWRLPGGILAPGDEDPELLDEIQALRASGERVITVFDADDMPEEHGCDRRLVPSPSGWRIEALPGDDDRDRGACGPRGGPPST
jgi:ATP phosphoribosyltransferase regulatory subunit